MVKKYLLLLAPLLILILVSAVTGYLIGKHYQKNLYTSTATSRPAYITAQQASQEVDTFYSQYIRSDTSHAYKNFIMNTGTNNLKFYKTYYQHGFDPITCSIEMPVKVKVGEATSGSVAVVKVTEQLPNGQSVPVVVNVVIDNEGLKIDSVMCPGNKGNLPPTTVNS